MKVRERVKIVLSYYFSRLSEFLIGKGERHKGRKRKGKGKGKERRKEERKKGRERPTTGFVVC